MRCCVPSSDSSDVRTWDINSRVLYRALIDMRAREVYTVPTATAVQVWLLEYQERTVSCTHMHVAPEGGGRVS